MNLINADTETRTDETGETGGPDINLGKNFSKRFTWQDPRDDSYWTVDVTNYIRGVKADGEDVEVDDEKDLLKEYDEWVVRHEAESKKIQDRQQNGEHIWLTQELEKWRESNPVPIRYFWQTQVEYIQHSNLDDPGGSELTTEFDNEASSHMFYDTKESAEEGAKADMDQYSPLSFNPENF